jgi:predicted molibdopterin-dependent oxidoreductase YjgC
VAAAAADLVGGSARPRGSGFRRLELPVQDNWIVKVTSPLDHDVGHGHLCVKGRFGFELVQRRAGES